MKNRAHPLTLVGRCCCRIALAVALLIAVGATATPAIGQTPLSPAEIGNMVSYVRSQLDSNVVGYQFALMQSGRILRQYSYGKSNLRTGESMRSSMRLNLGSISKLITTVSVLKLAEQGRLDLDAPFFSYLNRDTFPAEKIHPSVQMIAVRELLTHTSSFPTFPRGSKEGRSDCRLNCPQLLAQERNWSRCRVTLESGAGSYPYRCGRGYQNANFHLLRFIIESASKTTSVDDLVEFTRELWLDEAGLDMSCSPDPEANMRYYTVCDIASYGRGECLDGTWYENPAPAPSEFCSSGGWRASALGLMKLIDGLRSARILGPEMTGLLLDTWLEADGGDPGSTAVGWEPPWPPGDGSNLGKNGALPQAVATYVTLLPDQAAVALLINTNNEGEPPTPGISTWPVTVLQAAYRSRR